MIKLNKTTEYALIAIKHIASKQRAQLSESGVQPPLVSAREVSDQYQIPFEILSKTLQKMKEHRMIESIQGARGGYTLHPSLLPMNFIEFLDKLEGTQALVSCVGGDKLVQQPCTSGMKGSCTIKGILHQINEQVRASLQHITMKTFIEAPHLYGHERSLIPTPIKNNDKLRTIL